MKNNIVLVDCRLESDTHEIDKFCAMFFLETIKTKYPKSAVFAFKNVRDIKNFVKISFYLFKPLTMNISNSKQNYSYHWQL